MEHLAVLAPPVQIFDVPVPQMVDNVMDALRLLDPGYCSAQDVLLSVSISFLPIPEPQSAEQLVEVPTMLSPHPHRHADRGTDR